MLPDGLSTQAQAIRVLVVDDYEPWRRWVCSELQKHQLRVLGEASDGLEAVSKAQALKPTLIFLDIGLPKLNGLEAARRINQSTPGTKIVFLTKENDADIVKQALITGAAGYLLKDEAGTGLLAAVEAILQGERYIGSRVAIKTEIAAQLATFSAVSAIGLAIVDDQRRFRMVNNALVAMHNGIPAEAFVGSTIRDIVGDAASGPEARLDELSNRGETPAIEVSVELPLRAELPHFIEKNFVIQHKSGKVVQVASLALDVTANRKLENHFQKLESKSLFTKEEHGQLARELHESVSEYHAALATDLDRFSEHGNEAEKIPELLAQSVDAIDAPVRKLVAVTAKCFPKIQPH